ncbi:MAG TPA: hypothetical protein VK212_01335 [Lentimicrobium sp.]|nr:hypothetical protein [Lentimicrobium sp.]
MQENKNIFENSAGDILRNFEQEPPSDMWDRIEGGLKRRNRKILFLRYASLAATLLILLSFGIYFLNEESNNHSPVNRITQSTIDPYNNDKAKKEPHNANDKAKAAAGKTVTTKTIPGQEAKSAGGEGTSAGESVKEKKTDLKVRNINTPVRKSYKILNNTHISQNGNNNEEVTRPDGILNMYNTGLSIAGMNVLTGDFTTVESSFKPLPALKPVDLASMISPEIPEESGNAWSLALGYGMTSGTDLTQNEETLENTVSRYSYDDFSAQLANQTSFFEEIDNTIHDAPVSIGLVIGKSMSNRLSLESGITYTRLAFRIKTDDLSPFYRKYRNEMYYLGVPAGVRYSFLKKEKFNLYALQWAVLEKGIAGRWHIETYNNNELTDSESKDQVIRGVQLSSVTALGGQYKLGGNIYLFGQGGIQVFYLNKTQPFNIRSQKVAWPSVQAGLRVDF